MKEITEKDFKLFVEKNKEVIVGGAKIKFGRAKAIKQYQPENFELERTNAWSFPDRGTWATHRGDFRGNWPPQVARNIILRFSKPNEIVLDQMCGSVQR